MKRILYLLVALLLSACDYGVEWKSEPYEVIWIDTPRNRTLNYNVGEGASVGRVEDEVIAVGSNQKYIVAKQKETNTGIIWFYYIEREKDDKYHNWHEITQGQFSEKRFKEIRSELGLPEFTREF